MKGTDHEWNGDPPRRLRQTALTVGMAVMCLLLSGDSPTVLANESCGASPGAGDYCASSKCGPCTEGEGDCDPGQCAAGLECVEEGAVDRCRLVDDSCGRAPGAGDYCGSWACGPCGEGEGDCDPGQCAAGLECVEEGAIDRCRPVDTCDRPPGASDYCGVCGPCGEGEGDCDPGQCAAGLECVEEGAVDRCRPTGASSGSSNFQVQVDGVWKGICCVNGSPRTSEAACTWTEADRRIRNPTTGKNLTCDEGPPTACWCTGWAEPMHGINGWEVGASLYRAGGGPMYSDYTMDTCVYVQSDGKLATKWTDASCPSFRLE